jgi:hypothetical protein
MNPLSAHPCDMADPMRDILSAQPSQRGYTMMGRRVAGGSHPSVSALRSNMSSTMENALSALPCDMGDCIRNFLSAHSCERDDTMMGRCIANGSH